MYRGAVVVKAWAPWCGSCRTLSPIIDEVAAEVAGVAVVGFRVDSEPELVEQFGVRSVPTLIALRDGIEVGRLTGLQPVRAVHALFHVAAGEADDARPGSPAVLVGARAVAGSAIAGAGAVLGSATLIVIGAILVGWAASGLLRR